MLQPSQKSQSVFSEIVKFFLFVSLSTFQFPVFRILLLHAEVSPTDVHSHT